MEIAEVRYTISRSSGLLYICQVLSCRTMEATDPPPASADQSRRGIMQVKVETIKYITTYGRF